MPATITHAYFALDIYKKLKNKQNVDKIQLMTFSQSSDPFMFYNIMNLKKGKNIRKLQKIHHTQKINIFFDNLLKYVKENNYYTKKDVLTYIYGTICHYSLDTNAHPYIIYKSGIFEKNKKETYKYNGLHNFVESYIDNYFFETKYCNNCFDSKDFWYDKKKFSKELNNTLNYTFKKTYNVNNIAKIYYISLKQMNLFIKIFRIDKTGTKQRIYKVLDQLKSKKTFKLESLSYNIKNIPINNILNEEKVNWYYPVDKSIKRNNSFEEIYNNSIEIAFSIINEVNDYFFKNKNINIENLFKNKNYITGIDCNSKKKQKYFEF